MGNCKSGSEIKTQQTQEKGNNKLGSRLAAHCDGSVTHQTVYGQPMGVDYNESELPVDTLWVKQSPPHSRVTNNSHIVCVETVMEGITNTESDVVAKDFEKKSEDLLAEYSTDSVNNKGDCYDEIEDGNQSEPEELFMEAPAKKTVTHEMVKCLDFEEKVDTFKQVILNVLIVREILPYLPFVDHDELRNIDKRSPKEAVIELLNVIKSYKDIDKWNTFMEALSECGYEYIVKTIRGYSFITYHYQAEYLKNLAPILNKMIQPIGLLAGLHASGVLSQNDREEIEMEYRNNGNINSTDMLLSRIPKKHPKWYTKFIEVLRVEDFHEIADMLDIPNLTKHDFIKELSIKDRPKLPLPPSEELSSTNNTPVPSERTREGIHQAKTMNKQIYSYLPKDINKMSDNTDRPKSKTKRMNCAPSWDSKSDGIQKSKQTLFDCSEHLKLPPPVQSKEATEDHSCTHYKVYEGWYEEYCEEIQDGYQNLKDTCTGGSLQEKYDAPEDEYHSPVMYTNKTKECDEILRDKIEYLEKKTTELDKEIDLIFDDVQSDMVNKLMRVRELRRDKNIDSYGRPVRHAKWWL